MTSDHQFVTTGTDSEFARAEFAADFLRQQIPAPLPKVGLVLGSGLGGFAAEISSAVTIPYSEIPGFPCPSAEGHAGQLVIGQVGEAGVAVMQGRVHLYEGLPIRDVVFPVRVLSRLGVKAVVFTNAAGGISPQVSPGSLVVLKDHINLLGLSPLAGPNDPRFGVRFPDMSEVYAPNLREIALAAGRRLNTTLFEGVYAAVPGPNYETPAEIRYLRAIGADLVGMSTVPEAIVARHMGIQVLAISCVTNMAAGILNQPITHDEVLVIGQKVQSEFTALLKAVLPGVAKTLEA